MTEAISTSTSNKFKGPGGNEKQRSFRALPKPVRCLHNAATKSWKAHEKWMGGNLETRGVTSLKPMHRRKCPRHVSATRPVSVCRGFAGVLSSLHVCSSQFNSWNFIGKIVDKNNCIDAIALPPLVWTGNDLVAAAGCCSLPLQRDPSGVRSVRSFGLLYSWILFTGRGNTLSEFHSSVVPCFNSL